MTAKVQAGAFIAAGAQVCESAQVKSGAKILDQAIISGRAVINAGAEISGRAKVQGEAKIGGSNVATKIGGDALVEGSAMVTGNTQVIARAKVRGSSKVHNAIICQASLIEGFDVVDSDYYCQTEDPEPAHPGELGKKTLLGVDSDRDGVRDDLEIWINNKFSNTQGSSKKMYRENFKAYARMHLELLKYRSDTSRVRALYKEIIDSTKCLRQFHIKGKTTSDKLSQSREMRKIKDELFEEFLNTNERVVEWDKVLNQMDGQEIGGTGKKVSCF